MKYLGYINEKTRVNFEVDSIENPTYIHSGKYQKYPDNLEKTFVNRIMLFRIKFKINPRDNLYPDYSGMTAPLTCIEKDTGHFFVIINSTVSDLLKRVSDVNNPLKIDKDGFIEEDFVFIKEGRGRVNAVLLNSLSNLMKEKIVFIHNN